MTLGDLDGNALNLGTAFDAISEKSATRYFEQQREIGKPVKTKRLIDEVKNNDPGDKDQTKTN